MKDFLGEVLSVCCDEFGVSEDEVRSTSRRQELVYCRKAFCLIVKERLDLKYQTIGSAINRSVNQVSVSISKQPTDKYYKFILLRIRGKIDKSIGKLHF